MCIMKMIEVALMQTTIIVFYTYWILKYFHKCHCMTMLYLSSVINICLISISTQEELDMKVLKFQNKKLAEKIEQRRHVENDLKKRIDQLENRQRTNDAVLMIVNRYWNQVSLVLLMTRTSSLGVEQSLGVTPKTWEINS